MTLSEVPIERLQEVIPILQEMIHDYMTGKVQDSCRLCRFSRRACYNCPWVWIEDEVCPIHLISVRHRPGDNREEAKSRAKQIQEWIDKINKELEER